jgi:chemotaxis protein CheX
MNVNYINPFINASINVFENFGNISSEPGQPIVTKRSGANGDIIGFIGLNGHGMNGYFTIHFSKPLLSEIIRTLFDGKTIPSLEELYDLVGELTNMISGNAKAELSKKGFFFDVAIPKISNTAPNIPSDLKNNPVIIVPFETRAGRFNIQASFRTIEEDLAKDTMEEVSPPTGHMSVTEFAKVTRIDPIKIRRFLKTGFLIGEKISNRQWHIPESELKKVPGSRPSFYRGKKGIIPPLKALEETMSVDGFSKLSGLPVIKIKNFLRSGFLKGRKDKKGIWQIEKAEISKFTQKP